MNGLEPVRTYRYNLNWNVQLFFQKGDVIIQSSR